MGQDLSRGSGDCWLGDEGQSRIHIQASSRERQNVSQLQTPRGAPPAALPQRPASMLPSTSELFGGAYIPEMMQGLQDNETRERQIQKGHSYAEATDRDIREPPSATFVGQTSGLPAVGRNRGGREGDQPPNRFDDSLSATSGHMSQDDGGPAGRPSLAQQVQNRASRSALTPRRSGASAPLTPRGANGMSTPKSRVGAYGSDRASDRSVTPEKRDSYVATKGGWIQTSVTISDMNIAAWTQQKQDMFIEAVAATAQVGLCDVCVLSLKEKCGRRLLSIATEITFQVRANTGEHAREIVKELKSQTLDNMMLHANIRIRPDTARGIDVESGIMTPRSDTSNPLRTPFRNGYSLSTSYQSQFGPDHEGADNENIGSANDASLVGQGTPLKGPPIVNKVANPDDKPRLGDPTSGTMLL